ncbi:MAG TPA: Ig-like domain-containing protein [Gaiellaceae bacterium]
MFQAVRVAGALTLAATYLALAGPANAATVTMTGETLNTAPLASTVTVQCGATPSDTSTVEYFATGAAAGPYPGTFTEHGLLTFHGNTGDSYTADFTITSGATTITGTKHLAPVSQSVNCGPFPPFVDGATVVLTEVYEATVSGPLGTFTESGRATTALNAYNTFEGTSAIGMQQGFESGGPPGVTVTVSPVTATNPVGTTHTVTITVRDATGEVVQGEHVLITVAGSTNQGSQCTTDANGQCNYTYQGPDRPGADEITACADTNANGTTDAGEPCAAASKAWSPAAATPGGAHGGGYIRDSEVAFGFSTQAQSPTAPVSGACSVIDRIQGVHIRCTDITSQVLTPGHVTFFGTCMQDGVATNYRIDAADLTNLGAPDTFTIQTDLGFVAGGPLTGGNVIVSP